MAQPQKGGVIVIQLLRSLVCRLLRYAHATLAEKPAGFRVDSKFASEAHYIRQRMKLLFQHMEDKDLEAAFFTLPSSCLPSYSLLQPFVAEPRASRQGSLC